MTNEIEKTMDRTIRMAELTGKFKMMNDVSDYLDSRIAAEFRQNLKEEYDKLIYKEVNNVD